MSDPSAPSPASRRFSSYNPSVHLSFSKNVKIEQ
nr:MAG TPA: hypothetical protein [Caudoviricetes sp.]